MEKEAWDGRGDEMASTVNPIAFFRIIYLRKRRKGIRRMGRRVGKVANRLAT